MKVKLSTQMLLNALGQTSTVAPTKSTKPVLECVSLRVPGDGGLLLEATDLDVAVRIHLADVEVEEEGALAIPAARLLAVVREVGDEETTLVGEGQDLHVDSRGGHFRIRGEDVEQYPVIPSFPTDGGLSLPGDVLRSMIRRTVFATAKEAGRYALHGVLVKVTGDCIEFVATDGRRLARAVRTLDSSSAKDLKVIVGPKGLSLLDRAMGEQPGEVLVALESRQVLFQVGGTVIVSRLIDGTFPAYEDVIPKACRAWIDLPVEDFSGALRRAALLTTRDASSVQFDIGPGLLTIRSRAPEIGEACVEMAIPYDGERQHLGFNPAFLVEGLKVMAPDRPVRFEFTDAKAPSKFTDGDAYVYVVMPIALE